MQRKITLSSAILCCGLLACAPAADDEVNGRAGSDTAAAATAGARADTAATTTQVTLTEWSIGVSEGNIPAGQVRFEVRNEGQYEHAFEVEGQGIEEETKNIPSGGSATLTVNLPPGTYELYCPIDDTHGKHEELGMRTTLVVR